MESLAWEEVRRVHQQGILLDVEHVEADLSKKEQQDMTLFGISQKEMKERLSW